MKHIDEVFDLEDEMHQATWFKFKVQRNKVFAQHLYAALCNNEFQKIAVLPLLRDDTWACSWRSAGRIVADLREYEDYLDWYYSGVRDDGEYSTNYVAEGHVTDEIRDALKQLGWVVKES